MEVSWLFSFRIRNDKIHEMAICKRQNTMREGDLGTIVSGHVPIALALQVIASEKGFPNVCDKKC